MYFYCAPMEGLTGYIYRNAHHAFFDNINKYFSPFIVANQSESFKTRELNDILPENNNGIPLIPQILTNNAKDFIHTSKKLTQLGYDEINLNLGCPSGTVVSKGKGAGFLAKTKELDEFLDEIFSSSISKISIKTRLGKDKPEEFYELIEIFNRYPLKELIIHPRIQTDFYKNKPNSKVFQDALLLSKNPVCYNGDIFTLSDYIAFTTAFPVVQTIMLGRGLITNPGLAAELSGNKKVTKSLVKAFHDKLYEDYKRILSGDRNVLYKMKGLWVYLILLFSDNAKHWKRIKKAERLFEYEAAVLSLFSELEIV